MRNYIKVYIVSIFSTDPPDPVNESNLLQWSYEDTAEDAVAQGENMLASWIGTFPNANLLYDFGWYRIEPKTVLLGVINLIRTQGPYISANLGTGNPVNMPNATLILDRYGGISPRKSNYNYDYS